MNVPRDIGSVVDSQAGVVLVVRHLQIRLKLIDFRVSHIGTVEKRAEE